MARIVISTPLSLLFLLLSILSVQSKPIPTSPYFSPTTLFQNYDKMLNNLRIYIYPTSPEPFTSNSPSESLFHASLLDSPFVTQDPNEAHLFFVPFSTDSSTRAISRVVKELRRNLPYWDRTLGADHFFLSRTGIDYTSDRSVLELKKNAVQISCFPTTSGNFIPHKDITLPPFNPSPLALPKNKATTFLGYMKWISDTEENSTLVDELNGDAEFVVESEQSNHAERVENSKFCLFLYSGGDMSWIGEALAAGCVPAVITDRPIQDLPLMDVMRWSDIAVFAGTRGGIQGMKDVLGGISEERYELMRGFGVTAARHLVWNESPQPNDAFHMLMYQLWLRRHTIRYARRE